MKKHIGLISAAVLSVSVLFASCSIGLYYFDDIIPELYNQDTQYENIAKVIITSGTGASAEFTDAHDIDVIRMQLEGIQAFRSEPKGDENTALEIQFITVDGTVCTVDVVCDDSESTADVFLIDGYRYDAYATSMDLAYIDSILTSD